jgi:site-specific DNA recombinase
MGYGQTALVIAGVQTLRAGIWIRVSSGKQDEEQQLPDITQYIDAHGYLTGPMYQLHDLSAFKGEQDKMFAQALADIRAGVIDVLICWHSDRLDRRGIRSQLAMIEAVRAVGGKIECVKESWVGSDDPESELNGAVSAYVNHKSSADKSVAVRRGQQATISNGGAINHPPFGYASVGAKRNKHFVPTEAGRKWVPVIFQAVADGKSLAGVVALLAELGATDLKWSPAGIAAMIRNSTYQGMVTGQSGVHAGEITHECPPLVTADLWARANAALSAKSRKQQGPLPKAMLAKVLKCEHCGATMTRKSNRAQATGTLYYRCTSGCGMVRASAVETAVTTIVKFWFSAPEQELTWVPGHGWDAEIAAVKYRISKLDLDADDYDDTYAALRAELRDLKSRDAVPGHNELKMTGRSYYQAFMAESEPLRGRWLASRGFTVNA